MKKLYTLAIAILLSSGALLAQDGHIVYNGAIAPDTITVNADSLTELLYPHNLKFVNTSGSNMDMRINRVLLCDDGTTDSEQLCFGGAGGACIDPFGAYYYTTPAHPALNGIAHEDSVSVDPKWLGDGTEAAVKVRLVMFNGSNANAPLDTVYIKYFFGNADCQVASIEESSINFDLSAYPNPANGIVNFNVELNGAVNSANISVVDMLGKKVFGKRISGTSDKVRFTTADVRQGVYFYSLTVNGEIKETKKLVVKH